MDAGTINTTTGKSLLEKVQEQRAAPRPRSSPAEGLAKVSDNSAIRARLRRKCWQKPQRGGSLPQRQDHPDRLVRRPGDEKMRGKADPQLTRSLLEELLAG